MHRMVKLWVYIILPIHKPMNIKSKWNRTKTIFVVVIVFWLAATFYSSLFSYLNRSMSCSPYHHELLILRISSRSLLVWFPVAFSIQCHLPVHPPLGVVWQKSALYLSLVICPSKRLLALGRGGLLILGVTQSPQPCQQWQVAPCSIATMC